MDDFQLFSNYRERGDWVELKFMAESMRHGYKVLKPWGDSQPFDVALHFGRRIVRVQVKSSSFRFGTGYLCQLKTSSLRHYTLDSIDFFAAYIPTPNAWYLIPARLILGGPYRKQGIMLHPMQPLRRNRYLYEHYREAWPLLTPKGWKR
jgi:hypothetical protein